MKISYDSEVDAIYITLVGGKHQVRTVRLTDEISLDFGADEVLVGIEILDAREVLGHGELPRVVVDNLPVDGAEKIGAAGKVPRGRKARKAG